LYQRLHGLDHQPVERARSPFNKEQTRVLIVDDVSTYFKQRQRSLPRLTELLRSLMMCKPGRYLIALPSYAYLQSVAAACSAVGLEVLQQTPAQSNTETQALMNALHATPAALLFVVMGGSMGESLDFADVKLNGVVMVGVGLPPRSLTRDLVADYFTLESADPSLGQVVAYMQPALVKVVQAAGRLIRGPQDRGVICLIDPRFCDPAARQFFPEHWTPERVHAADVVTRVEAFWQQAPKQMTPEGIASKVSAHE
jgi:Rad3-related DNA helicase